jgi:hypothetical protein
MRPTTIAVFCTGQACEKEHFVCLLSRLKKRVQILEGICRLGNYGNQRASDPVHLSLVARLPA